MDLSEIKSFEQLADYLRKFVNLTGDPVPYDFDSIAHLLGALLENLQAHAIEADFEEFPERFTREQFAILRRIVASAGPDQLPPPHAIA